MKNAFLAAIFVVASSICLTAHAQVDGYAIGPGPYQVWGYDDGLSGIDANYNYGTGNPTPAKGAVTYLQSVPVGNVPRSASVTPDDSTGLATACTCNETGSSTYIGHDANTYEIGTTQASLKTGTTSISSYDTGVNKSYGETDGCDFSSGFGDVLTFHVPVPRRVR